MAIITVTSEYSTGSQKVASGTAEKLGFEYVGDQLIAEIARELHVSKHEADMFRQASQTSVLRFLDRYTCQIIQRVVDHEHGCLDDDTYYLKTRELVERIYENNDAVILGWGAQCILQGKPDTFHILLTKDDELKIRETMNLHRFSREGAEQRIRTEEADRKAYIAKFFNADWMDSRLYDMVIDMGKRSIEEAVDMICDNARHHLKSRKAPICEQGGA